MAFIGKGVCFDSGGLSLKPAKSMEDMKWDMGGAAVTVGLLDAVSKAKLNKNVIGIIGLVENMPGPNSLRPGDIIKSLKGDLVQVNNTDAEGRLLLGDLLWYSQLKFKPKRIFDLANSTFLLVLLS